MQRETSRLRWVMLAVFSVGILGMVTAYGVVLNRPNDTGPGPWTLIWGVIPEGADLGNPKCWYVVSNVVSDHVIHFCLWVTQYSNGWELDGYYDHGLNMPRVGTPSMTAGLNQQATETAVTPDGTGEILWGGGYTVVMGIHN